MPTLSRVVSAACFPRNCRLDIELATTLGTTMTSGLSLTLLPKTKMMSRQALMLRFLWCFGVPAQAG